MTIHKTALSACIAALFITSPSAHADPVGHDRDPVFGVTAGAGAIGFADDETNDMIDHGGMWEVRGIFGVNAPLAIEAAYLGSYQSIDVPLLDASLVGNGIEGAARLNISSFAVQPYLVAGAGWMHYDLRANDMSVDVASDDDVFTIPSGAGISFYAGPALVDLRATYRWAFDDELLQQDSELEARDSLDSWSATARAGLTF